MVGRDLELLWEADGSLLPLSEECLVYEDFVDEFANDELRL